MTSSTLITRFFVTLLFCYIIALINYLIISARLFHYVFMLLIHKLNYDTFSRIQGTNLDILVQTPGRLASAHPIPHDIIPAKK